MTPGRCLRFFLGEQGGKVVGGGVRPACRAAGAAAPGVERVQSDVVVISPRYCLLQKNCETDRYRDRRRDRSEPDDAMVHVDTIESLSLEHRGHDGT